MSTNTIISLSGINYAYNTHAFVSLEESLTGTKDIPITIEELLSKYEKIFGEEEISEDGEITFRGGGKIRDNLLSSLSGILNESDDLEMNDINAEGFYASAKCIESKSIDENCLEGYRAYSFYLEKIVGLLNRLDKAITQGQEAIGKIQNLKTDDMPANQTLEEYVNSKVHELSAELYMADKTIADVEAEFESCLKYNADTKSWDKASYEGSQLSSIARKYNDRGKYEITLNDSGEKLTFNHLRRLEVDITDTGKDSPTHTITCFSELNLLDRLRYIRYYYELVLSGQDSEYQIFPDDSEKGYPCVPDKKSTTDTKATESMGGFELFYVGYLVDRDGSIDAYSSCLEAKSTALTNNISLQSEHIEAYNQYLTFINRATQLLNESQSEGAAEIPHGVHLGLTYFCGGTMRDLLELNGVNYIVLSCTNENGSMDDDDNPNSFNYGYNDRYLLVRADEKGLKALYNTEKKTDPNDEKKQVETITAGDLDVLFKGMHMANEKNKCCDIECDVWYEVEGFEGTNFYKKAYREDGKDCPIIFSSGSDNEILLWDCPRDYAEQYLPKQLVIQEIEPNSVAEYDKYYKYGSGDDYWGYAKDNDGNWKESAEEANRVINSWTTAFSNKSEYINTAIETINTDITSLRTKMDTIDSLCSTLRNRSFETKKTLVSNLRS